MTDRALTRGEDAAARDFAESLLRVRQQSLFSPEAA